MQRLESCWAQDGRFVDIAVGRDIGYDFARLGLPPIDDWPGPVAEGFKEGAHVYARCHDESSRYERKLLRLRLSAYRRNRVVDPMLTPEFLGSIDVRFCPITRIELTAGTGGETDATVDRVFNGGGYAIGNVAMMSMRANRAKAARMPLDILKIALAGESRGGMSPLEWMRLACLTSLAAPPGYPRSNLPMLVFPPNGILLSNGYTLIQVCTSSIAAGLVPQRWGSEMRSVLSGKASKKRFDLFIEALVGQVTVGGFGALPVEQKQFALCDAWAVDLVCSRYTKFISPLQKAEMQGLIGVAKRAHQSLRKFSADQLEAWSLATRGYACLK